MGGRCCEFSLYHTRHLYPLLVSIHQSEGDLWYFPAGNPHSIQAKDTKTDGAEFLLIFDKGSFSEDATFLLTDWLAHIPKSVLAKNFGMDGNLQAFDHIPQSELYIFPGTCSKRASFEKVA